MIPIYNSFGEKAKDSYGNVIYTHTEADDELKDCLEPSITIGGRKIPVWLYIEMYCPVEDRDSNLSGFALNRSQIEEYKVMARQYVEDGRIRLNIGKSRQMGGTTLISAFLWTRGIANVGMKTAVVADTEMKGIGILHKYKVFYYNTPEPIASMLRKCEAVNNSKELTFDFGKGRTTTFEVIVQGENAGASKHFNQIHESEVALWERIKETVNVLEKTVSTSDRNSAIIRETTARGHNHWETLYQAGKKREDYFRSIFIPWYWEKSYSERYNGHKLNEYEIGLREKYGLSDDQIQFWYLQWKSAGMDYPSVASEFPTNDVEMFSSSGISVFPTDLLAAIPTKEPLFRGKFVFGTHESGYKGRLDILSPRWVEDPNGCVSVYKTVPSGHPLFSCTDPAKGGSDYWATHIIDNSDFTQIAVYHQEGRKTVSDQACLQSLVLLVAMQCGCFHDGEFDPSLFDVDFAHRKRAGVTAERNSTEEIFDIAWRMGLRNIPRDNHKDGYRTGTDNRQPMIDMLKQMLRDTEGACVNDEETVEEMMKFQFQQFGRLGNEKAMAAGNAHDDLVMALAGACYMRTYFPTTILDNEKKATKRLAFDPMHIDKKEAAKHPIEWR